jgi:predicted nucleotide-binding protein
MTIARRIFVSSPRNEHLDDRRNELKWAIVNEIETLGYEAQVFGSPEGGRGLPSSMRSSWSPAAADQVMQRCVGAAILGFPIWQCSQATGRKGNFSLVTEYCHYEGAIARTYGLPILAVLEEGVEERVFFNRYAGDPFITIPAQADITWVAGSSFRAFLDNWNGRVRDRRDIFLAYSGKEEGMALGIKNILTGLGATVLDWKKDFPAGPTILEQVENAARRTSGGVFLLTRDDRLQTEVEQFAPRDNVIFEAGYFVSSKGHERVLILRKEGAKMPADLGGVIYERLADAPHVNDLQERLQLFLDTSIWSTRAQSSAAADAP